MIFLIHTNTSFVASVLQQQFGERFPGFNDRIYASENVQDIANRIRGCEGRAIVFTGSSSSSKAWIGNVPGYFKQQSGTVTIIWASNEPPRPLGRSSSISVYLPKDMKAEEALEQLLRHDNPEVLLQQWMTIYASPS